MAEQGKNMPIWRPRVRRVRLLNNRGLFAFVAR